MTNRFQPHLLILPEDDANNEIINGFLLELPPEKGNKVQVLTEAGGWGAVVDKFCRDEAPEMKRYTERYMILVIDLDNKPERIELVLERVPPDLAERVFVLGVLSEPEKLKKLIGRDLEALGTDMARDCSNDFRGIWGSELLRHNRGELERIRNSGLHHLLF